MTAAVEPLEPEKDARCGKPVDIGDNSRNSHLQRWIPSIVTPRWYTWTGSGAQLSGNALAGRLTTGATKAPAHMEDGSFVNRASGSGRDNPRI
jgi:hypothetical protein